MKALLSFLILITSLAAAPFTRIEGELHVPLESEATLAIIDQATGKIRLIGTDGSSLPFIVDQWDSGLPGTRAVTSGLNDLDGNEALALASPDSNRLVYLNTETGNLKPLFPEVPVPTGIAFVRRTNSTTEALLTSNPTNLETAALSLDTEPEENFANLDIKNIFSPITSLQPYFDDPNSSRYAIGIETTPTESRLLAAYPSSSNQITSFTGNIVPEDSQIASNIRRIDGSLMIVTFVEGSKTIGLHLLSDPLTIKPRVDRSFGASVAHVSSNSPTPDGFLVTFTDGTGAHYRIDATDNLILTEEFDSINGLPLRSLAALPDGGLFALNGGFGASSEVSSYSWDGSVWSLKGTLSLPPLPPTNQDFATLFWFDSEPVVTPEANLLRMDTAPDWTSKQNNVAIPGSIFTETFLDSLAGLDNPTLSPPNAPSNATFLLTNQVTGNLSLTALDSRQNLVIPRLDVAPESNFFDAPILATARFDSDLHHVFYRNLSTDGEWKFYQGPIPVAYSGTYQFFARNKTTNALSPIVERDYQFFNFLGEKFDSDNDHIPDFVEIAKGLDPRGGADSDGDGATDLEELLRGTDPTDSGSTPDSVTRPFNGEGFFFYAQATNVAGSLASEDEVITLRNMTSGLLSSALVQEIPAADPPGTLDNQFAAPLESGTPVPNNEWIILHSDSYFNTGEAPKVRDGREIIKVIRKPLQLAPEIDFIAPVIGNDIEADAIAWIETAEGAYKLYEQVTELTTLEPLDTLVAAMAENHLYFELGNAANFDQAALQVPPTMTRFTLFGHRSGDSGRLPFSLEMKEALFKAGFSFELLLSNIQSSATSSPEIRSFVQKVYNFHRDRTEPTAAPGAVIPNLPLPLEVFRSFVNGTPLHPDYASKIDPVLTLDVKGRLEALQSDLRSKISRPYRPVETFEVQINSSSVFPGIDYEAFDNLTFIPVELQDRHGNFFALDQGLGTPYGAVYSVTGYTDVFPNFTGIAVEVISLSLISTPLASEIDTDGNLLGDDWEEYFFGERGAVAPLEKHPGNGYSYLQLFLLGHDPRETNTAIPDVPAVNLLPAKISFNAPPEDDSENLTLTFSFPSNYLEFFNLRIQSDTDLNNFQPHNATLENLGPDLWQFDLGPVAFDPDKNFFRLGISIKAP